MKLRVETRKLRPYVESERNYVLSSWLREECHAPVGEWMGTHYYQRREPYLRELVLPRCDVVVAVLPENDDVILGWVAAERGVPLGLTTKRKFSDARGDIERALLDSINLGAP